MCCALWTFSSCPLFILPARHRAGDGGRLAFTHVAGKSCVCRIIMMTFLGDRFSSPWSAVVASLWEAPWSSEAQPCLGQITTSLNPLLCRSTLPLLLVAL